MKYLLSIFCLYVVSLSAIAELPVFPGAVEIRADAQKNGLYRLALGPQKRIDGSWRAERLQPLLGDIERMTLQLPEGFGLEDAYNYYAGVLNLSQLESLYMCRARDCGPSNSWANHHFKVAKLYGLDARQRYSAYLNSETAVYTVLYLVQRGNGRVLLQLEQVTTKKASK